MKIIIAEDDLVSGKILTKWLTDFGHEPALFKDGGKALDAFLESPSRIVISDWMMPVMDGLELCRKIRELEIRDYTHFILQTANTSSEDYQTAMDAQVDDFFRKPLVKNELHSRLLVAERMIQKHTAAQAAIRDLARFPEENPNPVLKLSPEGNIIYANFAGAEVLKGLHKRVGEPAPEGLSHLVGQLVNSGSRQSVELSSDKRIFSFAATSVYKNGTAYLYGHDITDRKKAEDEVIQLRDEAVYRSQHDLLTGLPNRSLLSLRLEKAIERSKIFKTPFVMLVVDIDNFKSVNDGLGHQTGDEVIKRVSESLMKNVRKDDVAFRWGGDEFVILLQDVIQTESIEKICERFSVAAKNSVKELHLPVPISLSIGYATYPNDSADTDTLLQQADQALYDAKAAGRDCSRPFRGFPEQNHTKSSDNLFFLLSKAVTERRIDVHYQPLINATTEEVVALEALARWNEPSVGWVSPEHFISIAEQKGLMLQISEQVLDQSLAQLKTWLASYQELQVSINLSRRQLQQPGFASQLQNTISSYQLSAKNVIFEITEREAFAGNQECQTNLNALFNAGFLLSLDDFGSGYSTFELLCEMPFHELKLNKELVQRVHTDRGAKVVQSIVELGRRLDMTLVAEGIEEADQKDFLKRLGVQKFQGYHFSKPLPVKLADEFLASRISKMQAA